MRVKPHCHRCPSCGAQTDCPSAEKESDNGACPEIQLNPICDNCEYESIDRTPELGEDDSWGV